MAFDTPEEQVAIDKMLDHIRNQKRRIEQFSGLLREVAGHERFEAIGSDLLDCIDDALKGDA